MSKVTKIAAILSFLCSSIAMAHDDDYYDRGYERESYPVYYQPAVPGYYREEIVYVPERVVEYVQPPIQNYVPPPAPQYYTPPPRYNYRQVSPQGLVAGIAGGVIGYEISNGDPIMTGVGAAAGALLGN